MKKSLTILLTPLLFSLFSCSSYYLNKANQNYHSLRYKKAINYYDKVKGKKKDPYIHLQLARSHQAINEYRQAGSHYRKAMQGAALSGRTFLDYANLLKTQKEYQLASSYLKHYLKKYPNDSLAREHLYACKHIEELKDSFLFEAYPINIDSSYTGISPTPLGDGIVFSSDQKGKKYPGTGTPYLNMYFSKDLNGCDYEDPQLLEGNLESRYHDGPAVFSPDGKRIYFTRSNLKRNRKLKKGKHNTNHLQLYTAELLDEKWVNLEKLPFNGDDYSIAHPGLSADGKTLYFASDKSGGFGGTDIYCTRFKNGAWTQVVNLGKKINTAGNESFPFIHQHEEDEVLYFASTGHPGLGGMDLFRSTKTNDQWTLPQHLSYPFNSPKDDFGPMIYPEGTAALFSSNRLEKDRIYKVEFLPQYFYLKGIVINDKTFDPLKDSKVILNSKDLFFSDTLITGGDGTFVFPLEINQEYELNAKKHHHFKNLQEISTLGLIKGDTIYVSLSLKEMELDVPVRLDNIYYDFNKFNIRPDAALELDKLVKMLRENPEISMELGSHSDSRGSSRLNLKLSKKRAKSAVDYIISKGIDPNRIQARGYGEQRILNECKNGVKCNDKRHEYNRRSEFRIIKFEE